jgi:internalin A
MTQVLSEVDLRRLYDQQIRSWFGEVRPLRLEGAGRFFTPPPALPLRAVYVPPALSATYFQSTVGESHLTGGADVLHWFERDRRLVVLGDPGSGKSTLVSWLAWRLCAGLTEGLPNWADGVLPVPMILRDMQLGSVSGFDDLLAAHVRTDVIAAHPELQQAWGRHLQGLIENKPGSLLFLIDGLDELSASMREKVRDAIREGMARIEARFLVTSRIVGYQECAIESAERPSRQVSARAGADADGPSELEGLDKRDAPNALVVQALRLYVMPFDTARIRQFSRNWFEHGETEERRGEIYFEKFMTGLLRDPVALQLARTPNLLVMAAQVFGITNTLPDGRAKLYEAITKAYLESIDQRYGLADQSYTLEQKKAWLAAVGYQMQVRRSSDREDGSRDLLVAESDVRMWLSNAMRESELEPDENYVNRFVDAIARRSGLFIPRGDGQYAFAHLSIQEYFAALHLQNAVRDHAVSDPTRLEELFEELAELGATPAWREALVTFFELPEWSPKVIARLFQAVFGNELGRVPRIAQREKEKDWQAPVHAALVECLARLVVNPGIALPAPLRERGFESALVFLRSERKGKPWQALSGVLGALTANEGGSRRVWEVLRSNPGYWSGASTTLDLRGARMVDFSPLLDFANLTELNLESTLFTDLSLLAGCSKLEMLSLVGTPLSSLESLPVLPQLQMLNLDWTQISDLVGIERSSKLRSLSLANSAVSDLLPLAGMKSLRRLDLARTLVSDLKALCALRALESLSLHGTTVGDLTPLQGMSSLEVLDASETLVTELDALSGLRRLKSLSIHGVGPSGLAPLQGLPLSHLSLNGKSVNNLQPLANMTELRSLMLFHTAVSDVTPLARLTKLRFLYLIDSAVTDTSPLAKLTNLEIYGLPESRPEPLSKPKSRRV